MQIARRSWSVLALALITPWAQADAGPLASSLALSAQAQLPQVQVKARGLGHFFWEGQYRQLGSDTVGNGYVMGGDIVGNGRASSTGVGNGRVLGSALFMESRLAGGSLTPAGKLSPDAPLDIVPPRFLPYVSTQEKLVHP